MTMTDDDKDRSGKGEPLSPLRSFARLLNNAASTIYQESVKYLTTTLTQPPKDDSSSNKKDIADLNTATIKEIEIQEISKKKKKKDKSEQSSKACYKRGGAGVAPPPPPPKAHKCDPSTVTLEGDCDQPMLCLDRIKNPEDKATMNRHGPFIGVQICGKKKKPGQ